LSETGKVDYIAVGGGNLGFDPDLNTPSAYYPQGLFVNLAEAIKKSTGNKMKVMSLGRIIEPAFADSIIADGKADLVIMMRALIADPELPKKALEGRVEEIIPCIGCNQGCLGHVLQDRSTTCILNPIIGREESWGAGSLQEIKDPKNVVIVGAGPSGLECARISAIRGHKVTIFEQSDRIGGQARLASVLPGRTDLERALKFWENETKRLGINILFGIRATIEQIKKMSPDIVVCATGSELKNLAFSPAFPQPTGTKYLRDISEIARLKSGAREGKDCFIYDDRGDFQAFGWAELCVNSGSRTVLLTRNPILGMYVDPWTRFTAYKRLNKLGVRMVSDSFPKEIKENAVSCCNVYNSDIRAEFSSEFSYFLSWPVSKTDLFDELSSKETGTRVFSIGDCKSPRSLEEAIYEGHELARTL
ncbi:MAG: FAD-dependent oxidoreductase, partial [Nitrososphaerales archaeon]